MSERTSSQLTQLLAAAGDGDAEAQRELWSIIYGELRAMAGRQMAAEAAGHTLQPTALVHEAFFRLFGSDEPEWSSRRHFFAAAAKAMRDIRVDDARRRNRLKRGGGERPGALVDDPPAFLGDPAEVLAVHEALDKLEQQDPRKAEVAMLRYFAGLTVEECASALGVSPRTVDSDWGFARVWLHRELSKGDTTVAERE